MKILFTSVCKPIPIFLGKYLSIDDVSYRYAIEQGPFSAMSDSPCFSLHFLAQNLNVPSVVLEWPTFDELKAELQSDHYDYVGISFKELDFYRIDEMVAFIRKVSPKTQIILGGYGTLGLNESEVSHIRDSVDHICWTGDGVKFLRNLIGDFEERPMIAHLPVEEIYFPWLKIPAMTTKIGYLLSALGCVWKCEFCCTSAYAEGRFIEVMSPEELVESMKWYYKVYPDLGYIFIMDEELLLRQRKVNAIGELIRNDEKFGLDKMNYVAFGTLKAISRWDPEELLLNGVGVVWTGIESKYSYHRKKGEVDQKELIHALHEHGIESQLSWIVGDDCQTQANIHEDSEDLIQHQPCSVQLTSLVALPGTPLYERLKKEGRLRDFDPDQYHLFGYSMDALHFTHEERLEIIFNIYRRIYESQGPSVMRKVEVYMNGYAHCSQSKNPYLNGPKREFFKKRIQNFIPLIKATIEFAPTVQAKQAMLDLHQRYVDVFGPLRKTQQFLANRFLKLAEAEMTCREKEGYSTLREIPLKRYTYSGR